MYPTAVDGELVGSSQTIMSPVTKIPKPDTLFLLRTPKRSLAALDCMQETDRKRIIFQRLRMCNLRCVDDFEKM